MTGSRSVNVRGRGCVIGRGSSWVGRARSVNSRGSSLLARSRSVIGRARSATRCGRSPARGLGSPSRGASFSALGRGRSPARSRGSTSRGASVAALGRGRLPARGRGSTSRGASVSGRGRSITRGGGSLRHGGGSPIRDIVEGYSSPDRGSKSPGRSQSPKLANSLCLGLSGGRSLGFSGGPKRANSLSLGLSGGRFLSAQKPKLSGEGFSVPVLGAPGLSTTTTVPRALNRYFDLEVFLDKGKKEMTYFGIEVTELDKEKQLYNPDPYLWPDPIPISPFGADVQENSNAEESFVLYDDPKETTNGEENSAVLDDAAQPESNAAAKKKNAKKNSTPDMFDFKNKQECFD